MARMAGAMMVGGMTARVMVDLAVMAGATADRETAALRVADQVDREIAAPIALVVSGADRMVLLAARDLAAPMVVLAVAPAVPMVLAAEGQDVVQGPVVLVVPEVRAEGVSNNGWIKSTASSTKSSARLSL